MRFAHASFEVEITPALRGIGIAYRPLLMVKLHGPKGDLRIQGLLDTGADQSLITRDMADAIGLTPLPGAAGKIQSAGGDVRLDYSFAEMELAIDGQLCRWPLCVGVADEPWDTAILGFRGFLEYFDVGFFGHELEFELVRNTRPFNS